MVKLSPLWRVAAAGLLLALALTASAAPARRSAPYELDRQTLALGEPLQLRITRATDAAGGSLEALDLSPLQRDFEILERTLGRDSQRENLTLTLYPRRVGRIELPTLGLPGHPLRVTVTEGSDTVPRVHWKLSLEPAEPLLRQASTFTLEACDDGTLLWKRPLLPSSEGLMLRPLNETEIITQRDGQRCTAHRWHWALLPTAPGTLVLPLPVMEAGKFGRRLRFAPPALALTARALPAWLPAEAAVGQPEIVAEPLTAQAVLDQPLAWRLRVTGSYSAQSLQTLLAQQLGQGDGAHELITYAPRIEPLAAMTAAPQHLVTLYLLPRQPGTWNVPDLQWPWYDPQTGMLKQTRIKGAAIDVIDPVRQRWLRAGWMLLELGLALLVMLGFWRWQGWRLRQRRLRKGLSSARTVEDLCRRLQAYSLHRGDAPAPTLRIWQARMEEQFTSRGLSELLDMLERSRYATSSEKQSLETSTMSYIDGMDGHASTTAVDLEFLIQRAYAWIRSVKPRW